MSRDLIKLGPEMRHDGHNVEIAGPATYLVGHRGHAYFWYRLAASTRGPSRSTI